jgi:hypothetical protein
VLGSVAFLSLVAWTTTFMALVTFVIFLVFPRILSFGATPLVLIEFTLLYFTKILLMVIRPINLLFTLHVEVNLWKRSSTNWTLVMVFQCQLIMLFCLE